ncbi:hypothetical protein [Ignavibacterium sp.]|uniref:hypothetical protein n=1 Tax=Ignavibacterium sp. TaxID=2651167 RepID=UPI00307D20CD
MGKNKFKKLQNFDIFNSGFNAGAKAAGCVPQKDAVWCKQGDLCGTNDRMCTSLCPQPSCRHDGCCTGWWDWGGDDATALMTRTL